MTRKIPVLIILLTLTALSALAVPATPAESSAAVMPALPDSAVSDSMVEGKRNMPWYKQLLANRFNINDPSIDYPAFPRFCVDVYNWGDRVFNTYDSLYVVGSGKNWKLVGTNHNWFETYVLHFDRHNSLHILSDIYPDVGINLSFMAVGIKYVLKPNSIFGNPTNTRKDFNFSFTSALFTAAIDYSSTRGGTKIVHFGDYMKGHSFRYDFDEIHLKSLSGYATYFFNHRRYSHAAAYCWSKFQLRSAGTWIAGLCFSHQNIVMDFSQLPPEMLDFLPSLKLGYTFHYTDYNVMGGYGYNWVLYPRRWLINGTFLPSVGYKHSYEDTSEGRKDMFAMNARTMFSVVYNHRDMFTSLMGQADTHLYFTRGYTFINSIQFLSLSVGFRF